MERRLLSFMLPKRSRFQITSALSVLHRLAGIALAIGSISNLKADLLTRSR